MSSCSVWGEMLRQWNIYPNISPNSVFHSVSYSRSGLSQMVVHRLHAAYGGLTCTLISSAAAAAKFWNSPFSPLLHAGQCITVWQSAVPGEPEAWSAHAAWCSVGACDQTFRGEVEHRMQCSRRGMPACTGCSGRGAPTCVWSAMRGSAHGHTVCSLGEHGCCWCSPYGIQPLVTWTALL